MIKKQCRLFQEPYFSVDLSGALNSNFNTVFFDEEDVNLDNGKVFTSLVAENMAQIHFLIKITFLNTVRTNEIFSLADPESANAFITLVTKEDEEIFEAKSGSLIVNFLHENDYSGRFSFTAISQKDTNRKIIALNGRFRTGS